MTFETSLFIGFGNLPRKLGSTVSSLYLRALVFWGAGCTGTWGCLWADVRRQAFPVGTL